MSCDLIDESDADCSGINFGTAFVDSCGICSDGTTGIISNANLGCDGKCHFDQNPPVIDGCGVCGEGQIAGECSICDDDETPADCYGDCPPAAAYDACDVCGGDNSGCGNVTSIASMEASGVPDDFNTDIAEQDLFRSNLAASLEINESRIEILSVEMIRLIASADIQLYFLEGSGNDPDVETLLSDIVNVTNVGSYSVTTEIVIVQADCNDVPNGDAVVDCAGECNGNAVIDECGVCDGEQQFGDCSICDGDISPDCFGECPPVATLDDCGICNGDNSSCLDCAGTPNGTAVLDCSGICNGPDTIDACGICGGPGIPDGDCDCFLNTVDGCGVCGGDGFINCMCPDYIPDGSSNNCSSVSNRPYINGDQLSCDDINSSFNSCYPSGCDGFSLADFSGRVIWILYEEDW